MNKIKIIFFILLSIIFGIFFIFFACNTSTINDSLTGPNTVNSSSSSSAYAFQDNFNSYSLANPWAISGGWTGSSDKWAIVAGYSGNAVQNNNINAGRLVSSYSGTDCTVSAKFCSTVITNNFGFGLFARSISASVYYAAEIVYLSGSNITRIAIYKFNSGNGAVATASFKSGQLNTSSYYILTLSVSGSVDPYITASVTTDGTTDTKTINWTDDGTFCGSRILGSGNAGLWTGGAALITFDDFTVTEP